jgi:hypothetical protein
MPHDQADLNLQDNHYSHAQPSEDHAAPIYNSIPQNGTDMIRESQRPEWEISNTVMLSYQNERPPNINGGDFAWLDGLSLDLETFDSSMFRASKVDWLGCETDVSDQQTLPPLSIAETQPRYFDDNPSNREEFLPRDLQHASSTQQEITKADPPSEALRPEKEVQGTWPAVLDRGGNEMWPFDYSSNKGFRKIKLPPLREILEQTVGLPPAIKTSTVRDLIRVLSSPLIPSLTDSSALEVLPAIGFLREQVKTYFAQWHLILPMLHVPTWQIENCSSALVAALACIGATYSNTEGSQAIASLLAEITQRSLFWMVSRSKRKKFSNTDQECRANPIAGHIATQNTSLHRVFIRYTHWARGIGVYTNLRMHQGASLSLDSGSWVSCLQILTRMTVTRSTTIA